MDYSSQSIGQAVEYFSSLPSIGKKTAQRLVFHLLRQEGAFIENFSKSIASLANDVVFCSTCFNFTEYDPCPICSSEKRKNNLICVVEQPSDITLIEKTGEYFGRYHVLHGLIDPLGGISPDLIKLKELVGRMGSVDEVILALNPTVEGEITIQYLSKILKPLGIKITKIASGIPIGSSLEFTDQATLSKALEGRIVL
jgi:recombination protein RecR